MSVEVAEHSPDIQSLLSSAFGNWQQAITTLLRSAIDRGDLPRSTKADELASFLLNSYEGALVRSKAEKSDQPLETFIHFAFKVLLKSRLCARAIKLIKRILSDCGSVVRSMP